MEAIKAVLLLLLLLLVAAAALAVPMEESIIQTLDHLAHDAERRTFVQRLILDAASWGGCGFPVFFVPGPEAQLENPFFPGSLPFDFASEFKAMLLTLEHRFYGKSIPFGGDVGWFTSREWSFLSSRQALEDIALLHQNITTRFGCSLDPQSPRFSPWIAFGGSYPGLIASWLRLHCAHLFLGAVVSGSPIQITKAMGSELWMREVSHVAGSACTAKVAQMSRDMDGWVTTLEGRTKLRALFKYLPTAAGLGEGVETWFDFFTEVQGILTYALSYNPNTTFSMYPWPLAGFRLCSELEATPEEHLGETYARLGQEICTYQQAIGLPCGIPFGRSWMWQRCTELALPFFPFDPASGLWSVHINWDNFNASCTKLNGISALPEQYLTQERWSGNPSAEGGAFGAYATVGNFYFAVGTFDPSLHFLPVESIAPRVKARLIPDSGHGVILTNFFWPGNPHIAAAIEELRGEVSQWLAGAWQ